MVNRRRIERFLRTTAREAGRRFESVRRSTDSQLEEAKAAYGTAKNASVLPKDEEGRVRIVCRRYTERRAVALDEAYRPACFDADHPDCEGCLEDITAGSIETW